MEFFVKTTNQEELISLLILCIEKGLNGSSICIGTTLDCTEPTEKYY